MHELKPDLGLISSTRWLLMNEARLGSWKAWALVMRSMLALWPYFPATTTQGVDSRRLETLTLETLSSPMAFFHHLVKSLNSSLSS